MRPVLDTDARRALAHYAAARRDVHEADVTGREAAALRVAARWCLSAEELGAGAPAVRPVLSALAAALAAPTPAAWGSLAEATVRWCQEAAQLEGEERLAPLMLCAVDVAALASQVQTDREAAARGRQ